MSLKYARRFPRILKVNVFSNASKSNPEDDHKYRTTVWRDLWELFRRVWALENGTSGPGGSVTNITATAPIVVTPSPITSAGVVSHTAYFAGTYPADGLHVPRITSNATGHVTAESDTAIPDMVGDAGAGGTHGLVPAPGAGDTAAGKFLKADGTWQVPPGGGGSTGFFWALVLGGN